MYLNERYFYLLWSEVIETKRIHALPICGFSNSHTHRSKKFHYISHIAWNFIEMNFVIPITSTFTLARTTCSNRHSSPNVKLIVIIAHNYYQRNVAKWLYSTVYHKCMNTNINMMLCICKRIILYSYVMMVPIYLCQCVAFIYWKQIHTFSLRSSTGFR